MYAPWDVPIEVSKTTGQWIVFGRVKSGDMAIVPNIEGEGAGDGGDDGGDGDEGSTTSGGSIDSVRVNSVLLAVKSQYMHQSQRT